MDKKKEKQSVLQLLFGLWTGQMETMWELMRHRQHIS